MNILPVPDEESSLVYRPAFNVFQEATDGIVKSNTSATRAKFNYDNRKLTNSVLANTSGASKYYSANNASNSIHRDYIPEGKGYVYSQTEFANDGTGRVVKQSNVGEEFRIDGPHAVRSSYGTAATEELVRLFGSNAGKSSHYKKNLAIDANGQINVSYVDQHDHVVATALAGDSPANVEALDSYKALDTTKLTVNLDDKNAKVGGLSSIAYTFMNVTPDAAYTFEYDLSAYGANLAQQCIACKFDLEITLTDPDGVPVDLSQAAGNEVATGGTGYERKNISAQSCTSPTVLNRVRLNVILQDIGSYTISKKLWVHELSYEAMSTLVKQDSSVQTLISQLTNSYVVDSAKCDICLQSCPEADSVLNEAIEEIASQDCENIYRQILQKYQDAYAEANPLDDEIYVVPDSLITSDSLYCQYLLCVKNEPSDVFEKKLVTKVTWEDAVSAGYVENGYETMLSMDPFFSDPNLSGYGDPVNEMRNKLNNVTVGRHYDHYFLGTIDEITDPDNTDFYVSPEGFPDSGGKHILYQDILNRKGQIGEDAYKAEVSRSRWALYRSFYLEAKRQVKITLNDFEECDPALKALTGQDTLDTIDEVADATKPNPGRDLSSPEDREMMLANLKFACGKAFSPADDATIVDHLKNYFDANPKNFFRLILRADVATDADLIAIDAILRKYNCGLDSVALEDPINCLKDTTVIAEPGDPGPTGGTFAATRVAAKTSVDSAVAGSASAASTRSLDLRPVELAAAAVVGKPSMLEYNALVDLYQNMQGSQWCERSGWQNAVRVTSDSQVPDISGWPGLILDEVSGNVVGLNFPANNIQGVIPNSFNNLIYLKNIDLGCVDTECTSACKNKITGIPASLNGLTELESLDLGSNPLSGTGLTLQAVLSSISQSSLLTYLDLSSCDLQEHSPRTCGVISMDRVISI